MKIALGVDHRGRVAAIALADELRAAGHEVEQRGPAGDEPCDYPDAAEAVGRAVAEGDAERGILICGSGIGMAIAANKVHGVRAAQAFDPVAAEMSRRHNDANVLALSADGTSASDMVAIARRWLETDFEGGRHARRVEKIRSIEASGATQPSG